MYRVTDNSFLSEEFLKQYENIQPRNKGTLWEVIYLRTYSRWREDISRRENWLEIIQRVVEYNISLYSGHKSKKELIPEAELMFDKLFHLEVHPAMRSMWVAGSEAAKKYPESNFGCSGLVLNRMSAFSDILHLSMCRVGVGFRVFPEDVEKLPLVCADKDIYHIPYEPVALHMRSSETSTTNEFGILTIVVGDSKDGWTIALKIFLKAYKGSNVSKIIFNYNHIRPEGERIKSFGGFAPGPNGLKEMFNDLNQILQESSGKLKPIDVVDMCCAITKNVTAGGTGRAALIAICSSEDKEIIDAKLNLHNDPSKQNKRYRIMCNNSIGFKEKPDKSTIIQVLERIKNSWEPGFINFASVLKKHPWASVLNPCSESVLSNRGNCNLSESVLSSHVKDGKLDLLKLEESVRLSTRISLRQTNVTWSLKKWDKVHKRDRLLGISLTGIMDAFDEIGCSGFDYFSKKLYSFLKQVANDEADKYSFEMRIPRPLLVTLIKPAGTSSQLSTVSCGIHRSFSPYFIRRIRISEIDPLCKALRFLGVPNEPDESKKERIVFDFPIKSKAKISANDEPAKEQFLRYLMAQKYYCDHNVSCTLTIGENEWEEMANLVYDNWDDIVACAFANKDNTPYPQAPYKQISKEQYYEMMKDFPDLNNLDKTLELFENNQMEEYELIEDKADCPTGSCPVR
jgi:ribonucleoside-diphosphate reductase alpha chain/ribonucleoside-triphosphate reductase